MCRGFPKTPLMYLVMLCLQMLKRHGHPLKTSSGVTLTNSETQTRTVFTGLAALSSVTPPPDMKVR